MITGEIPTRCRYFPVVVCRHYPGRTRWRIYNATDYSIPQILRTVILKCSLKYVLSSKLCDIIPKQLVKSLP